ncbi:hemolysin family protein [Sphingomonas bacterium]|uniref:hemolysin family protein n=1 Tax=Sphingomonas bacterium TaxID=1895847 RepID=UPI00157547B9|nr:hemolysin family protein [Sphingomonas bacterium]
MPPNAKEDRSSTGQHDESGIWRGLKGLIFGTPADDTLRGQLEDVIDRHEDDPAPDAAGDLSPLERQMVRNLLHFGERDANDVGVPRADIVAVEEHTSLDELVAKFADAGHSRLPVYRGSLDHVVGMVHVKDVFVLLAHGERPADWSSLIREPLYVPVARGALDLLADMRSSRVHLAIVLDEYGGTEGLVTIEDLIEEITGSIEDEHDDAPHALLVPIDGGGWAADGRAELVEVARLVDPRLAETDDDIDTLAGLAGVLARRVPEAGECLTHPSGWRLEVVEADPRRVERLRLHPPLATADTDA